MVVDTGKYRSSGSSMVVKMETYDGPPSLICTICGIKQRPKAKLVYEYAWFCPECANKLRSLIQINDGEV